VWASRGADSPASDPAPGMTFLRRKARPGGGRTLPMSVLGEPLPGGIPKVRGEKYKPKAF